MLPPTDWRRLRAESSAALYMDNPVRIKVDIVTNTKNRIRVFVFFRIVYKNALFNVFMVSILLSAHF